MNANMPVQRLARSATILPVFTSSIRPRVIHQQPLVAKRTIFGWLKRNRDAKPLDPMSEEFIRKKQPQNALQNRPQPGSLARGNIFEDDKSDGDKASDKSEQADESGVRDTAVIHRQPALMSPVLNPRPQARIRWQTRMIIRSIRKGHRINKTTLIARNEREHTAKSHFFKTSVKKLMPLARQIAGKPIEEAIVQMRFSKKKVAQDVLAHLERARDEATVAAGMGLGKARASQDAEAESGDGAVAVSNQPQQQPDQKMIVVDKKGNKRVVHDTTAMYIDQAWVGRGTHDSGVDIRAQGRAHRTKRPFTSITVQLKEEQTRIREQNERTDKQARKKVWVNLPDRPVTRQTQYPLW